MSRFEASLDRLTMDPWMANIRGQQQAHQPHQHRITRYEEFKGEGMHVQANEFECSKFRQIIDQSKGFSEENSPYMVVFSISGSDYCVYFRPI